MKAIDKLYNKINSVNPLKLIGIIIIIDIAGGGYLFGLLQKTTRSGINMNHRVHASEYKLSCTKCHNTNKKNSRFMDFPDHSVCMECHSDKIKSDFDEDCKYCHNAPENTANIRKNIKLSPLVHFDHDEHITNNIKCTDCHVNAGTLDTVTGDNLLPEMDTCVKCHEYSGVGIISNCSSCHIKEFRYIKPVNHTSAWFADHGEEAIKDRFNISCLLCHSDKDNNICKNCHFEDDLQ